MKLLEAVAALENILPSADEKTKEALVLAIEALEKINREQ